MIFRERKQLNKNFIIAGAVVLVVGLAVAIGVSLVDEPLDGNLPEGETTITTTIPLHKKLLNHEKFINSNFNVSWLDNEKIV